MNLEIAGFIIAVVGIILQLSDAFPQHREERKIIVLIAVGVALEMGASAAAGATYNVTGNVDAKYALLFGLAGLLGLFGLFAVFVNDSGKREAAGWLVGATAALFVMSGIAIGIGSQVPSYTYSLDEILLLANSAEERGQYEVATTRLTEARRRMRSEEAVNALDRRVARLESLQGGVSNAR